MRLVRRQHVLRRGLVRTFEAMVEKGLLRFNCVDAILSQVLEQGWSCLLCSHQHANIRPHVQLFLLVLFSRLPSAVPALLLPALCSFSTSSYQVRGGGWEGWHVTYLHLSLMASASVDRTVGLEPS